MDYRATTTTYNSPIYKNRYDLCGTGKEKLAIYITERTGSAPYLQDIGGSGNFMNNNVVNAQAKPLNSLSIPETTLSCKAPG